MDSKIDTGAARQAAHVRHILSHEVPDISAASRRHRRACDPAQGPVVQIDQPSSSVGPEPPDNAAGGDVRRVRLRVGHAPVGVQVDLLAAGDLDVHRAAGRRHGRVVAGRAAAAGPHDVRAVRARRPADLPVQAAGGDGLAVDGGERRVGRGQGERRAVGQCGKQPERVPCAGVHELAVACAVAVAQGLPAGYGAEEVAVMAHVLSGRS